MLQVVHLNLPFFDSSIPSNPIEFCELCEYGTMCIAPSNHMNDNINFYPEHRAFLYGQIDFFYPFSIIHFSNAWIQLNFWMCKT